MSARDWYTRPQEVWDEKKCAKAAKYLHRDSCGTPWPFRGYIYGTAVGSIPKIGGKTRYNGGITREGKWYQGEVIPLPKIHEDYEVVYMTPDWGYRIRKKGTP